jgi:hypothetical protein
MKDPAKAHLHHEFANAETYFLTGHALGEGMKKLLWTASEKQPTPDGIEGHGH